MRSVGRETIVPRRLFIACLFVAASAAAQTAMPIGIMRGELLKLAPGDILVRNAAGAEYNCTWDQRTYFERERMRTTAAKLNPGDPVEVVADRRAGSTACYARMVQVVDPRKPRSSRIRPIEIWAPRGNLTFSGMVVRRNPRTLVLKTREGWQTLLLRADTRFFGEGLRLEAGELPVNTRVFVRAGKNLDNELEAYQVIWGSIVQPR